MEGKTNDPQVSKNNARKKTEPHQHKTAGETARDSNGAALARPGRNTKQRGRFSTTSQEKGLQGREGKESAMSRKATRREREDRYTEALLESIDPATGLPLYIPTLIVGDDPGLYIEAAQATPEHWAAFRAFRQRCPLAVRKRP